MGVRTKAVLSIVSVGLLSFAHSLSMLPETQEGDGHRDQFRKPVTLWSLLSKAGLYVSEYHKFCRDFVAEERMIQREFSSNGKLKDERRFISDYFFITLPSAPSTVVEVREIKSIDGKTLPHRDHGLLELFENKSSTAAEETERIAEESTRYNLGLKRHSNMVNIGLNFLMPEHQDDIAYESAVAVMEGAAKADIAVLQFREETERTTLHAATPYGNDPLRSKGEIWLSLPQARVLKVDYSFRQEGKYYSLAGRYVSEYQLGPGGLLLPSRFQEYLYDTTSTGHTLPISKDPTGKKKLDSRPDTQPITFESDATYSNYRRFSTDVRILPAEPDYELKEAKPK
jgi:hypothetical protein